LDLSVTRKDSHFYWIVVEYQRSDPGPFPDGNRLIDANIFHQDTKESKVINDELLKGGLPIRPTGA
jgi:hypothetical protein